VLPESVASFLSLSTKMRIRIATHKHDGGVQVDDGNHCGLLVGHRGAGTEHGGKDRKTDASHEGFHNAASAVENAEETPFFIRLGKHFDDLHVGAPERQNGEDAPEEEDHVDGTRTRNLGEPESAE
jgi:hypothetical protein